MAFQARWRQLTKAGWRSSKATGLSDSFTCVVSGKKKKGGVRGQDYVVGEEELMNYLDRIDWAASLQTRRRLDDEFVGAVATVAESDVTPRFDERAIILDEEMKEEVEVERESETDGHVKYSTLDSVGENDEGTGWGDDALTEDGEPCVNLDEDGPAQPELRYDPAIMFDPELLIAAGGADQLAGSNVPKELLETITKRGRKPLIQQTPYDYLMEPYEPRPANSMQTYYPRLYDGEYGPTSRPLIAASTPSGAFFFFAQPTLWEDIATTSNGYFREKMEERIEGKCAKQEARKKKHPDFKPKTQDQIREELQKTEDITARDLYSLQLAIKYKKYYKSLFLGLVDLAIINAYIVYNARRAADGLKKMSHVKFLKKLHLELCQLTEDDWEGVLSAEDAQATPSKAPAQPRNGGHVPVPNDEWRPGNSQAGRKRRTRACKVCSLLKGTDDAKGGDSSLYCSDCKLKTSSKKPMAWRVFLCDKVRHKHNGAAMSCFEIWHKAWRNGTLLSKRARKRNIRARTPAVLSVEGAAEEEDAASDEGSTTGGPHQ
ncbi:Pol protein [Phytophthora cinnamomi]|uniref:Pol protein n=1 Tax=Phytophthora cinnamomi TaxID=4785 RepID=UPI003559A70F|nr:Pol protein [Phytophthora cinnamomi]